MEKVAYFGGNIILSIVDRPGQSQIFKIDLSKSEADSQRLTKFSLPKVSKILEG